MRASFHLVASLGVALLCGCSSLRPAQPLLAPPPAQDLVAEARQWTIESGLVEARSQLYERFREMDERGGWFERQVWRANADKSRPLPGSLATLSLEERKQVGIFLVLGYRQAGGRSPAIVGQVAETLVAEGWNARLVQFSDRLTSPEGADRIQEELERALPGVKRAVLVGFSKGGHDLVTWMQEQSGNLPLFERKKIRLVINFSGAVRGSAIAAWAADSPGVEPAIFRGLLIAQSRSTGHGNEDLRSISQDPWMGRAAWSPRQTLPNLRAIHYVALPEAEDGRSRLDPVFCTVGRLAERRLKTIGPFDGLVESAAQVYPASAKVPQWIVRVFGSHSILDGGYANGSIVAPDYRLGGDARLQSGAALMDDMLRSVPRSIIGL